MTCSNKSHAMRVYISTALMVALLIAVGMLMRGASQKAALQVNYSRTSRLMEKLDMGIMSVNRAGLVTHFSPSAETLFSCKAADVIGKNLDWMIPDRMKSAHDEGLRKWWNNSDYRRRKLENCTGRDFEGKEMQITLTFDPIKLDDGTWEIGVFVERPKETVSVEGPK